MVWGAAKGVDDIVSKIENNAIEHVYILPMRKIGSSEVKELSDALIQTQSVQSFYASGHAMEKDGFRSMGEMLAKNTSLKNLCIGNEGMQDEGMQLLCEGMMENYTVKVWDLEFKGLGTMGIEALSGVLASPVCVLETLNLSRNALTDEAIEILCNALLKNTTIRHLDLAENAFTAACMPALTRWLTSPECRLETLVLRNNDFKNASSALGKALARNTSLITLNLNDCQLSEVLLSSWSSFDLFHNSLHDLEMNNNELAGKTGGAYLAALLPLLTTLHRLSLSGCALLDDGACEIATVLASKKVASLTFLDLSKNELTYSSIRSLLQPCSLVELRLFQNRLGSGSSHLHDALRNSSLTLLDLGANDLQGESAAHVFTALCENTILETLEMGGNNLQVAGVAAMEALKAVRPTLDIAIDKKAPAEKENVL